MPRCRAGLGAGALLLAGVIGSGTVLAADFTFYSIAKGVYYDQTAGGVPVLKQPRSYWFHAQVLPVSTSVSARLKVPTSLFWTSLFRRVPFAVSSSLDAWTSTSIQADLDAAFPNGDYTFDVFSGANGDQFVTNTMVAGTLPNAPTVTNLAAAQSVDASASFTLSWDPFNGGTVSDFVYCQLMTIGSNIFATPLPGTAGALDGTASSLVIPGGSLAAGHAYLGRLVFAKTVSTSTNEQYGVGGAAFLFSQTDFWLRTQGGDNTPPTVVWTNPTNGATGVPSNLPIGVHFTKPMSSGFSVEESSFGSGSVSGGSRGSLSPDGLEVVLTPVSGYTAFAHHRIIFNPMEAPLGYGDLNGNPLAADTLIVSFTDGNFTKTPSRPWLTNSVWQPNGTFQVELKGEADFSYVLESSTKLTGWAPLATNIAFGGTARFTDTNGVADEIRLYRGRIK